jgi:hypothetical protein
MTVYIMSEDGSSIVSKVKTGPELLQGHQAADLGVVAAGYCALNKRHMNIRDVYDDAELKRTRPTSRS